MGCEEKIKSSSLLKLGWSKNDEFNSIEIVFIITTVLTDVTQLSMYQGGSRLTLWNGKVSAGLLSLEKKIGGYLNKNGK